MNIKAKKIVFIDEVSNFLSVIDEISSDTNTPSYEREVNNFIKKYYSVKTLEQMREYIAALDTIQLLGEEKFRIVNFKPKTLIELNLLVNRLDERLSKDEIEIILNLFNRT